MATNLWFWVLFNTFVLAMLALDLGLERAHHARRFHRPRCAGPARMALQAEPPAQPSVTRSR
jgi:hypothetical protein